jgi:integrase
MSATFHPAPDATRPFLKPRIIGGTFYNTKKPERSLGTKDLKEAQVLYDRLIGRKPPKRGNIRNAEAFDHFLKTHKMSPATHPLYEGIWRLYCGRLHGMFVSKVEPEHIIEVLEGARNNVSATTGRPLSEDRLNHIYVGLSAYFTAVSKEPTRYRDDNPVTKIGPYRPDTTVSGSVGVEEVLSLEEVRRLAATAALPLGTRPSEVLFARQMEVLIWVLAYSGMRLGEALALQQGDLRPPSASARFGEWKIERQVALERDNNDPTSWFATLKGQEGTIGSKLRFVPIMNAELRERLDSYIAEGLEAGWLKPGGLIFPTSLGRPRTVGSVGHKLREIKRRAGFERKLVAHHLRHTFVSWLLESGQVKIDRIALMVGHSVEVCRVRYAHLGDRSAVNEAMINAMAARHGEPAPAPTPVAPAVEVEPVSNVIQFPGRRVA